jgi:hypothetical protein
MGEMRNAHRILVKETNKKRPLGRPKSRWERNIEMDLKEIEYDGVYQIHLAHDRNQWQSPLNMVINFQVPY